MKSNKRLLKGVTKNENKICKNQLECAKKSDKLKNQSKTFISMFFKYANYFSGFEYKNGQALVLSR